MLTAKTPIALEDAQRTMKLVRLRAAEWPIDPHKIGVPGFSAGGQSELPAGFRRQAR
jgi:acetyl esterase/lipase